MGTQSAMWGEAPERVWGAPTSPPARGAAQWPSCRTPPELWGWESIGATGGGAVGAHGRQVRGGSGQDPSEHLSAKHPGRAPPALRAAEIRPVVRISPGVAARG